MYKASCAVPPFFHTLPTQTYFTSEVDGELEQRQALLSTSVGKLGYTGNFLVPSYDLLLGNKNGGVKWYVVLGLVRWMY